MKHTALVLVASLAVVASAHAQVWPNAAPSPYGGTTASSTSPPAPQPAPPASTSGIKLGSPPHALGAPGTPAVKPAPTAVNSTAGVPPVADADNPEGGRATTALNVLEAQGYASFSDFRPDGSMFTALVNDGAQRFQVVINPDTGQISRQ